MRYRNRVALIFLLKAVIKTYVVAIAIMAILVIGALLAGCTTTKYVEVPTVRTDSVYKYIERIDTIMQRDSVYIEHKGDTVRELRYKTIYKVRQLTDTVYSERTDSVAVPYPVEKKLTSWQQAKMNIGGFAIAFVLAAVAIAVVWLVVKKFHK
jgi:hypothetical protein